MGEAEHRVLERIIFTIASTSRVRIISMQYMGTNVKKCEMKINDIAARKIRGDVNSNYGTMA